MDWELVCERKELRATAQAIFMTGVSLVVVVVFVVIVIIIINVSPSSIFKPLIIIIMT